MINYLEKLIKFIYKKTTYGFYCICLIFSNGFFFYFYLLSSLIEKIIPCKFTETCKNFFQRRRNDPVAFLAVVFVFMIFSFSYSYFYVDDNDTVYINNEILDIQDNISENTIVEKEFEVNENKELNLYRKYSAIGIDNVNFEDLKLANSDTVAWIMVDGTSINYPVVQSSDNDYYLNHNYEKYLSTDGWIFMDYRNSINMDNNNTVFYGHNLTNKTSFGSLSNVFSDDWFNNSNHYIVVLTENKKYVYEIFSYYIIEPESYYLNNNVDYSILKNRSLRDFNVSLDSNDKIITLSTCTDDNKNRKVVHAKLINK